MKNKKFFMIWKNTIYKIMKHLKKFENSSNVYYIFFYQMTDDPIHCQLELFDNRESAENYYIYYVNDLAKSEIWEEKRKEEDTIFTFKDASEWVIENSYNYIINIYPVNSRSLYELPKNLKIGRDAKKYNL